MTARPAPEASGGLPAPARGLSRRRQLVGAAVGAVGLALVPVALAGRRDDLLLSTPVLLVLVVVLGVALLGGIRPALPAAVVGFLLLNFVFTQPYGTFDVHRFDQGLALAVYLATAGAVSLVVGSAARRHAEATRAAAEAAELSLLAGAGVGRGADLDDVLQRIRTAFGLDYAAVLDSSGSASDVVRSAGESTPDSARLRLDVSPTRAVEVAGRELGPQDQQVLRAFAAAAVAAAENQELARKADEAVRLASIDQLRTTLLAGVGHDLRTPLAGIKAAVSSLRAEDVRWTDEEREELLDAVESSANRLDALVSNLLAASRLDAGVLSVDRAAIDVEEIVGRGIRGLSDIHRVVVDVPENLPLVLADVGLAERVVANLVDNALRHSGKGTNVLVAASERERHVVVTVVDTGPGVPAGRRDALFAPYQRLGDRTPGGLGLGLSVAHGFTVAMGGTLEAAETAGGGLTMHIRLPRADQ